MAAARGSRPDEADDLLNLAEAAAARLDAAAAARLSGLPTVPVLSVGAMPQVIMQQVDVAVVTGRPMRALKAAQRMPPDAPLPMIAKARHRADVASAQTSLGHDREAVATLLAIERTAPDWMTYQVYPRTIVRELLKRERVRTPELRDLARRLDIA